MEPSTPLLDILILLGLFVLNGFFSLSEMALVSSRRARLKAKAEEGKPGYRVALKASEEPSSYLSTIQIGITLIGIVSGAFGGATLAGPLAALISRIPFLAPWSHSIGLALVVLLITFFSIVIGELVPKRIALSGPEPIAAAVVRVIRAFGFFFRPLERLLSAVSGLVLRLLGVKPRPENEVTEEEIRVMIQEGRGSGTVEESAGEMVEGVFYLGERRVAAFAMHRAEVAWLDLAADDQEVRAFLRENRDLQAFPVCKGSLDEPVGVVKIRDLFLSMMEGQYDGLAGVMEAAVFVPETMTALKAFETFRASGAQLILVLDEYGGMQGVLTLRDLVEEIVGELSTRGLEDVPEVVERPDGSALVDGLFSLDEFRDHYGLGSELPESHEYHTLAGFILDRLGSIPRTGEVVEWKGFLLEIVDMDGNRIDKVLVTPPPRLEPPDGAEDPD